MKWLNKAMDNKTILGQMLHRQLMDLAGEGILNAAIDKQTINRTTDLHLKDILLDWNNFCDSKTEHRDPLDLNIYSSMTLSPRLARNNKTTWPPSRLWHRHDMTTLRDFCDQNGNFQVESLITDRI